MEERRPIWRVAANILNKHSRTTDKGGLCKVLTTPHKNLPCFESFTNASGLVQDRARWRALVNAVMKLRIL